MNESQEKKSIIHGLFPLTLWEQQIHANTRDIELIRKHERVLTESNTEIFARIRSLEDVEKAHREKAAKRDETLTSIIIFGCVLVVIALGIIGAVTVIGWFY